MQIIVAASMFFVQIVGVIFCVGIVLFWEERKHRRFSPAGISRYAPDVSTSVEKAPAREELHYRYFPFLGVSLFTLIVGLISLSVSHFYTSSIPTVFMLMSLASLVFLIPLLLVRRWSGYLPRHYESQTFWFSPDGRTVKAYALLSLSGLSPHLAGALNNLPYWRIDIPITFSGFNDQSKWEEKLWTTEQKLFSSRQLSGSTRWAILFGWCLLLLGVTYISFLFASLLDVVLSMFAATILCALFLVFDTSNVFARDHGFDTFEASKSDHHNAYRAQYRFAGLLYSSMFCMVCVILIMLSLSLFLAPICTGDKTNCFDFAAAVSRFIPIFPLLLIVPTLSCPTSALMEQIEGFA